MLARPKMPFNLTPSKYASEALPTLDDWQALWAAWDAVTRGMIAAEGLLDKPIELRNPYIFYLGHIPTFLDIQLTKTTLARPSDPAYFHGIFERGIDPDVDNPEVCHSHSEIPDEWPALEEITAYQERVRNRVQSLCLIKPTGLPRHVGEAMWVGFEHEVMHLETLLYMMIQSDKTLPPPNVPRPDWAALAAKARSARVPNSWFDIPAQEISIGMDEPKDLVDSRVHYGW